MLKARLINLSDPSHHETLAQILLNGGVVGAIWAHHLYFLAGNAFDKRAVKKINSVKGRPEDQVLASPGAVEEAEEFADFKKSKGLTYASDRMKMSPREYLEFLFKKFPLGIELFANDKAPDTVTFTTETGKTIWFAGHLGDEKYTQLLKTLADLRKDGKKILFAGTSLNLKGENTLTVKEFEKVIEDFGEKIDAISVYPNGSTLKKLKYSTSCSVISFIGETPKLLRIGNTSAAILKRYVPGLQIPKKVSSTRKPK